MKLVLIYPGNGVSDFNTFGNANAESSSIPHGLASIAAYINKYEYDVGYIDIRNLKNWDEFKEKIDKNNNFVYGITATTVDFEYAIKCAEIIKKINPNSTVIIGGVHASLNPSDALNIDYFDHVICGEGEIAILNILNNIKDDKVNERLIRGTSVDLTEIPNINRDLFNHTEGEMIHPFIEEQEIPSATIITSRGCPYNCNFCQPAEREIFGGKVRLRHINDVVKELIEIKAKYGLESFLIHDDLFLIGKKRLDKFIELYKKSGLKADFYIQGRADLIIKYQKQIKELSHIGLKGILIGFESGSDRVLKFINKDVTVKENLEAASICKEYRIKIWANYMFGLPGESFFEMIKTSLMIYRISPDHNSPAIFTPYPKTNLYDYCDENDLLLIKGYSQYRRDVSQGKKVKNVNYLFIRVLVNFLTLSLSFKKYFENRNIK
jgi:radical SAM superfamily enzyme YgiQ (UPF0313 family)